MCKPAQLRQDYDDNWQAIHLLWDSLLKKYFHWVDEASEVLTSFLRS